jgi:cholesterol transport system auxiliary component
MKRPLAYLFVLLVSACVANHPLPIRYDLDGIPDPVRLQPRLNVTIAVPPISSPAWLRTTALVYRLSYQAPAYPRAYALSQWIAPPGELLTARLRVRIAAANAGVTLQQLPYDSDGYRLEVSLETFAQEFSAPDRSRCVVALRATLVGDEGKVIAQKSFRTELPAPSPDAAGGVEGLVDASDADFHNILMWLRQTLAALPTPIHHRRRNPGELQRGAARPAARPTPAT